MWTAQQLFDGDQLGLEKNPEDDGFLSEEEIESEEDDDEVEEDLDDDDDLDDNEE